MIMPQEFRAFLWIVYYQRIDRQDRIIQEKFSSGQYMFPKSIHCPKAIKVRRNPHNSDNRGKV